MSYKSYVKDLVVLVLVGLLAIEIGALLLSTFIVLSIYGGLSHVLEKGFSLANIIEYFKEHLLEAGLAIALGHILIICLRSIVVRYYYRKHSIDWRHDLYRIRDKVLWVRLAPLLVIAVVLDILLTIAYTGSILDYRPQAIVEYLFYVKAGTGLVGYTLAFIYYIVEGLWLVTTLEIGDRWRSLGGLLVLLIGWTPIHILRPSGLDPINLLSAITTAVLLEATHKKTQSLTPPLLLWITIVIV